ncbi:uncharacterized protein LOC133804218 [Humulus lupulus]|uniref:uncharacterized protein LOC133804218 n=1 Tax=Humulus lupulus TaxID=3486 RepID=UPI002B400D57|nr:uncharacterized protein LOC133804218 [Humulus lupulus]
MAPKKIRFNHIGTYKNGHRYSYEDLLSNRRKRSSLITATEGFYVGRWRGHQYLQPSKYQLLRYPLQDRRVLPAANLALTYLGGGGGDSVQFWVQEPIGLKSLVRVNATATPMSRTYFLTLEGTDFNFYEAEVLVVFKGKMCRDPQNMIVKFVRPAIYYPEIDQELLREYDAPDELAYESSESDVEPDPSYFEAPKPVPPEREPTDDDDDDFTDASDEEGERDKDDDDDA